MYKEFLEKLRQEAINFGEENNILIIDVEFVKEKQKYYLRVTADTNEGIGIDEITDLTNFINGYLDDNDIIEEEYYLEVTSPGAERVLKTNEEIIASKGKYVHINTYEKIDNIKDFEGFLLDANNDYVIIQINLKGRLKQVKIKIKQISKIRWAIKF